MSHESLSQNHEQKESLVSPSEAKEHHERLKEKIESSAEKAGAESSAEQAARHEVYEKAISAAEYSPSSGEDSSVNQPKVKTRQDKTRSFNTTMHHVRKDMRPLSRSFSKVIHQPVVEKSSEFVGKTVARPSGIFGAAIAAFIGLLFIFGVAKYAGFELSGSEMPILLIIGMTIGLLTELLVKSTKSLLKRVKR